MLEIICKLAGRTPISLIRVIIFGKEIQKFMPTFHFEVAGHYEGMFPFKMVGVTRVVKVIECSLSASVNVEQKYSTRKSMFMFVLNVAAEKFED